MGTTNAQTVNRCSTRPLWGARTVAMPRSADRLSDKEFGRLLKAKRQEVAAATGQPVTQADIAAAAGVSQGYVSSIEVGRRSARNLPGDTLAVLLSAYGFRRSEIVQLVRDFDLQYPPSFVEAAAEERVTALEPVVMEGSLSRPHDRPNDVVELPADLLTGHPTDTLRVREIEPRDHATPRARPYASIGSLLVRSTTLDPRPDDLVIVRDPQRNLDFLAVWDDDIYQRLPGTWTLPFSDEFEPVRIESRPQVVGVVVGVWRPMRRRG